MQVPAVGQSLAVNPAGTGEKKGSGTVSFPEMLENALKKLNDSQIKADELTRRFLTGEIEDIHQVTIAMQEARLCMQLAVEVRNRIVEAYQEISRMQV
ncbi:MAG TPA: flagellar hook-basal body complex protein FliE [Bacillota bacterium]|nr:flagellar hook-basal body complex protein FliE [Bacillota bacterium]